MTSDRPVRVAVVNDYPIIVEGVAAMLQAYEGRIEVAEKILIGQPLRCPVDVALYDTFGHTDSLQNEVRVLLEQPEIAAAAIFSVELSPALVRDAWSAGASGCISKLVDAATLLDGLVRIAAGEKEVVVEMPAPGRESAGADPVLVELDWPGKEEGLTERESQVLVLVAEGLTNGEIGDRLYLSAETVKTYLSQASRKLGCRNRVQAATYVARATAFARTLPPSA